MRPVQRFTNRVENYARYRPGYPPEIVPFLEAEFTLAPGSRIADLGSGTGKLAEVFLRAGHCVIGVEPNDAMRAAAEKHLAAFDQFESLSGTAEKTPLGDDSVDAIIVGQAFHWFDPEKAGREFRRILRADAGVALIWNNRRTAQSEFLQAYEEMLLRLCPEYEKIGNKHYDESDLQVFLGGRGPRRRCFDNRQELNLEELIGRVLSSSYAPTEGPAHAALMSEVRDLFSKHSTQGRVIMDYDSEVLYGPLDEGMPHMS